MTRSLYVLGLVAFGAAGGSLGAQAPGQGRGGDARIPRTHMPPPGMCRIWLDNVPAAQQPAPTDCASAVRNQPRNGRVIFSEEPRVPRAPVVKTLKEPEPARAAPDDPPPPEKKARPERKARPKPDRPDPSR
jgi:hypothetical protein